MRKLILAAALAVLPTMAMAAGPILEFTFGNVTIAVAKVSSVDANARTITLVGADGAWSAIKMGPEVRNFPQMQAGDEIKLAVEQVTNIRVVHPNDGTPIPVEVVTVDTTPLGAKPGAVVSDRREFAATITKIVPDTRTLTLQGPAGNSVTFAIPGDQADFGKLKAGDHIIFRQVTFTGLADLASPAPAK